jgi:hypothetical protein
MEEHTSQRNNWRKLELNQHKEQWQRLIYQRR